MELTDKIALVTGASRGIGKAIALELGNMGATVIGTATTDANAQAINNYFAENKISGEGMVLNVADLDSITEVIKSINAKHGAPAILINNAAIARDNLFLRMKEDEWQDVINTNLTSIYRVTKACMKGMLKARWGRIISLTSVVGLTGNPGQTNYAATKAGLIGFSKSLAQEIATRNITVNTVAPGFIETDMTQSLEGKHKEQLLNIIPMKRMGQANEIAAAVGFLASEKASYITGQTLHVNGGMFMG